MLSWLANAWRVPELRRRVLFTALILGAYRLGSWVPAPGVNASAISSLFGGGVLGLLSLFSGGALSRFSIFALGIMPYVTASIVLQLLTVAVPSLEQLKREGESGYAKITQYTRYGTVGIAAAQAAGYTLTAPATAGGYQKLTTAPGSVSNVATATAQKLTERTMFTQLGQVVAQLGEFVSKWVVGIDRGFNARAPQLRYFGGRTHFKLALVADRQHARERHASRPARRCELIRSTSGEHRLGERCDRGRGSRPLRARRSTDGDRA